MAHESSARNIDALARLWWHRHPNDPKLRLGKAIVADGIESLKQALECRKARHSWA